jgi:asparagine synthase (glutamine-hydrolysing)
MCGIVGLVHYREPDRPIDAELLRAMTRTLAHRGPDGEGIWIDGPAGLGHRRLAILDPTAAAAQPMVDEAAGLALTFNGEIYNFRELRDTLMGLGHRFRSSGDTEVLLGTGRRRSPVGDLRLRALGRSQATPAARP